MLLVIMVLGVLLIPKDSARSGFVSCFWLVLL